MRDVAYPAMDVLRTRYFGSHPDDRVIFHRKELMNKKPPFQALRDRDVEESFNRDFLNLVRDLNYVVFTVAIDKWEHIEKYHKWAAHPYHYCMEVLLERYQRWLRRMNAEGDVMAEARGKKEDYALAAEYTKIWTNGTDFISHTQVQERRAAEFRAALERLDEAEYRASFPDNENRIQQLEQIRRTRAEVTAMMEAAFGLSEQYKQIADS